jgi:hypothetical protein
MKKRQITAIFKNMGSSNEDRIPSCTFSDVAVTILARDYKGWGNHFANGVIEVEKLETYGKNQ